MGAIVWLASYPRSGNTWTRNFLHNLVNLLQGEKAETQDINKMGRLTAWEVGADWFQPLLDKPIAEAERDQIAAVRMKAQEALAAETKMMLFVKTHNCLAMTRGHPAINLKVTAGAVYIVRNPLDVAISYAHHYAIPLDRAIEHLNQENLESPSGEGAVYEIYGSWRQNVETWTRKRHRALYIMRYEDMLANPEETFGRLANHLLIAPTREQLLKAIELSSFDRLRQQEEAQGFREKPKDSERFFRAGKAGQWQEVLSAEQVERIVAANRDVMQSFGYYPLPDATARPRAVDPAAAAASSEG